MARLSTGTGAGTGVHRGTRAPAYGDRVHEGNRTAAFHNTSVAYIPEIGKADPRLRRGRVSGLTVGPGRYPADMSRVGLGTPPPALPAPQVGLPADGSSTIRDPARIPRRLGLTGALMMGIGALGAGALPVPNPLFGLRGASACRRATPPPPSRSPTPAWACWCWPGCGSAACSGPTEPWPRPRTAPSSRAPGCCGRCRSRWRRRCSPRTSTATSRRARSPRAGSTRTRSARPRRSASTTRSPARSPRSGATRPPRTARCSSCWGAASPR